VAQNKYRTMIKRSGKNPLDTSIQSVYTVNQSIFYNTDPYVKVYFGALLLTITNRLRHVLKPKYIFYNEMTVEQLADHVSCFLGNNSYRIVEADIAKCDKSQNYTHLRAEVEILKHFGMSDYIAEMYLQACSYTYNYDLMGGIKVILPISRKTGCFDTWFGNTLSTTLALAMNCPNMDLCHLGMFGGDDSLVIYPEDTDFEIDLQKFSVLFNFEVKLFHSRKYMYFSSKFILWNGLKYVVIPDPLKLVIRMSRQDIRDWDHLAEYYVGIVDNVSALLNETDVNVLNEAFYEKYKSYQDLLPVLGAIKYYLRDLGTFKTMFDAVDIMVDGWALNSIM